MTIKTIKRRKVKTVDRWAYWSADHARIMTFATRESARYYHLTGFDGAIVKLSIPAPKGK